VQQTLRQFGGRVPIAGDLVDGVAELAERGAASRANRAAAEVAIDPLLPARRAAEQRAAQAARNSTQRRLGPVGGGAAAGATADQRSRQ
jgi:hypothetical protein